MAVLLKCTPLQMGAETEHDNLLIADVGDSLRRFYLDRVKAPEGADAFVNENVAHITFVLNAWIRYMWDLGLDDEVSYILALADDPMDIFTIASNRAAELVSGMDADTIVLNGAPSPDGELSTANRLYAGLRLLTRTALNGAPWLERDALSKMIGASKWNRNWVRSCDHLPSDELDWKYRQFWFEQELLPIIRQEFREVFGHIKLTQPRESEIGFIHSNGAVQDACTNAFCKWLRVTTATEPEVYKPLNLSKDKSDEGRYTQPAPKTHWIICSDGSIRRCKVAQPRTECYFVRPIVVPKTFKAGRVVSPEKSRKLAIQKEFSRQIREVWKKQFPYEMAYDDQDRSRELVSTEGYASADQSSASDCIRRQFLKDVFPSMALLRQLLDVMPTHYVVGGRVYRMTMFGTMGSPLTFDMLGGTSLALARAACRWANILDGYGNILLRPDAENRIVVVGDDVVLPNWAFGCFLALLELCSLKPNMDKSYSGDHPFREACGYEGFQSNADVIYIPRGTVYNPERGMMCTWDSWTGKYKSAFTSLVALNNRFVDRLGFASFTARYTRAEIRAWCPIVRFDPFKNPGTIWGVDEAYIITDMRAPDIYRGNPSSSSSDVPYYRGYMAAWVQENGEWTYKKCRWAVGLDAVRSVKHYANLRSFERLTVSYADVHWVPDVPKATCLCKLLPDNILRAKRSEYAYQTWLRNGPYYDDPWCELAHTSSKVDYLSGFRMRPVTRIDTKEVMAN